MSASERIATFGSSLERLGDCGVNLNAMPMTVRLRIYGGMRFRLRMWLLSRMLGLTQTLTSVCIIADLNPDTTDETSTA